MRLGVQGPVRTPSRRPGAPAITGAAPRPRGRTPAPVRPRAGPGPAPAGRPDTAKGYARSPGELADATGTAPAAEPAPVRGSQHSTPVRSGIRSLVNTGSRPARRCAT